MLCLIFIIISIYVYVFKEVQKAHQMGNSSIIDWLVIEIDNLYTTLCLFLVFVRPYRQSMYCYSIMSKSKKVLITIHEVIHRINNLLFIWLCSKLCSHIHCFEVFKNWCKTLYISFKPTDFYGYFIPRYFT